LLQGKKWIALSNFQKSENDPLKVRLVKNSKPILECPRSLQLLLASTQVLNCKDLLKSYLAEQDLTATGKPAEIATLEIFNKTHGLRFIENHICFFLPVFKKTKTNKHTAPTIYSRCGGIKTLKPLNTFIQFLSH